MDMIKFLLRSAGSTWLVILHLEWNFPIDQYLHIFVGVGSTMYGA